MRLWRRKVLTRDRGMAARPPPCRPPPQGRHDLTNREPVVPYCLAGGSGGSAERGAASPPPGVASDHAGSVAGIGRPRRGAFRPAARGGGSPERPRHRGPAGADPARRTSGGGQPHALLGRRRYRGRSSGQRNLLPRAANRGRADLAEAHARTVITHAGRMHFRPVGTSGYHCMGCRVVPPRRTHIGQPVRTTPREGPCTGQLHPAC